MNDQIQNLTTGLTNFLLAALLVCLSTEARAQGKGGNDYQRIIKITTPPAASSSTIYKFEGVEASARKIDELIVQQLEKDNQKALPLASDEVFLRRAYLDIVGRVPKYEEAIEFLSSSDPSKRQKLIKSLLNSDGYVAHNFNFWADLLRVKSRLLPGGQSPESGFAYIQWLKEALSDNMPYDQMVRELLTAQGASYDNGAVGFYLRDSGMPLDNMAVTTQIFLGTQMVCAQCHDHPFDKWTQMDYYQMAAHSYTMTSYNGRPERNFFRDVGVNKMGRGERKILVRSFREIFLRQRFTKVMAVDRDLKLPSDYAYDNGSPGQVIHPVIPAGFSPSTKPQMIVEENRSPIESYAQWMTSKDNPLFAKVAANRLWKRFLGLGVIEPVDEFTDRTIAHNPPLMDYLEYLLKATNYDLKSFQEVILNTQTYQRETFNQEVNDPTSYAFQGPLLRRLSAEQIWDSLVSLAVKNPDEENPLPNLEAQLALTRIRWRDTCLEVLTPDELVQGARQIAKFQKKLSQNVREEAVQSRDKNADSSNDKSSNSAKNQRRLIFDQVDKTLLETGFQRLVQKIKENPEKAKATFGVATVEEIQWVLTNVSENLTMPKALDRVVQHQKRTAIKDLLSRATSAEGAASRRELKFNRNGMKLREQIFARSSDMRQPAQNGHFLRTFGQSDREVVDNYNHDASVMQALELMNGRFFLSAINERSAIRKNTEAKSPEQKLEVLFLSTLSRKPTTSEIELLKSTVENRGKEGVGDVLWTLLNTKQFIFIQ